jgi:hypothetical protein
MTKFFSENTPLFTKITIFLPKINEYVKLFCLSQAPSTSSHMPRNEGVTLHGSLKKIHDKVILIFHKDDGIVKHFIWSQICMSVPMISYIYVNGR